MPDDDLLEAVFDHLCEHQPEEVSGLSDPEIRRRAQLGIARAAAYGFTKPETIAAYVSLLFVAGPRFDQQPNIRKALSNPALLPDARFAQLFDLTRESDWDEAARLPQHWND